MGTPRYAAPEQFNSVVAGVPSQLKRATDIYEAGVTLYELITRQNPFQAPTVAEAKKLHNDTKLSMNNMISPAVFQVVRRATAFHPNDRYQSASEMKAALQRALMVDADPWYKRMLRKLGW